MESKVRERNRQSGTITKIKFGKSVTKQFTDEETKMANVHICKDTQHLS